MAADPYSTLGVARGASESEIKKAYRKLAKELHPDRNTENPKATERFSTVTGAYDLLSDADKRARFDRGEIDGDGNPAAPFGYGGGRPAGGFQAGGGDMGDIFEGLFGGRSGGFGRRSAPPQRGANVSYRLAVGFADAARREPQRITLRDGKTIDLKLPGGVESGTQMRIAGKGDPGPGGAGDAIITIEVEPHPFFIRDGDAVRLELPITLAEAILGGGIKVPTVDGPVMMTIPAGTSSGRTLRLKNRGFSAKDGSRGDQLVTFQVILPAEDATLKAWAEQHDNSGTNPRRKFGV